MYSLLLYVHSYIVAIDDAICHIYALGNVQLKYNA